MLHEKGKAQTAEEIQKMAVRIVATNPAGNRLQLIGGFRYRFLDNSPRRSNDIDYHTDGELEDKRDKLISLFERTLLPEVKRSLGYEGDVRTADGPGDDSTVVKRLELAFYKTATAYSRIEIPVEVTRVAITDKPQSRAVDGTVMLTVSNQDMVESKVIALVNRRVVEARDFVDIFLYRNQLAGDSRNRLEEKLKQAGLTGEALASRLARLESRREVDIRNIAAVLQQQVDEQVRQALEAGGGAGQVHDTVMSTVTELIAPLKEIG